MRYLSIVLVALILSACSNEFDLNEPKVETPVVYAVFDPINTAQYFRIERTFLDPEVSANVIAQNPDSIYYQDLQVSISNLDKDITYQLIRVDGTDEGLVRDEGVFATIPNVLYKWDTEEIEFEPGESYQLKLDGIFEDRSVTATTVSIDRPFLSIIDGGSLRFEEGKSRNFQWTPRDGNEVFSLRLFLEVVELNTQTFEETTRLLEWTLADAIPESVVQIDGIRFFQFLDAELEPVENVNRRLGKASIEITAGNEDIADLNRLAKANLGITASGEVPVFSNIAEGLGLFAAKNTYRAVDLTITFTAIDSLNNGRFTGDLGFNE